MADENYNFTQARTRLEEIVTQVRGKDVSLEKSLDLLEEGVRLANICTEQSDHTEWRSVIAEDGTTAEGETVTDDSETADGQAGEAALTEHAGDDAAVDADVDTVEQADGTLDEVDVAEVEDPTDGVLESDGESSDEVADEPDSTEADSDAAAEESGQADEEASQEA